jgi:hypothetical protein
MISHLDQILIKMRRMPQVSMRVFDSDCHICTSQQKNNKKQKTKRQDLLFMQISIEALTKTRDVVLDAYASTCKFEFCGHPFNFVALVLSSLFLVVCSWYAPPFMQVDVVVATLSSHSKETLPSLMLS